MRPHLSWFLGLALIGIGCRANQDELRAVQAGLDRELAAKQEIAQNLNERRRELDALERRLATVNAELTDAGSLPTAQPAPRGSAAPMMPEPSWLEGREGARQRAQIEETRRLISELEKVIGEVDGVEARKRELEEKLERLEAREAPKSP